MYTFECITFLIGKTMHKVHHFSDQGMQSASLFWSRMQSASLFWSRMHKVHHFSVQGCIRSQRDLPIRKVMHIQRHGCIVFLFKLSYLNAIWALFNFFQVDIYINFLDWWLNQGAYFSAQDAQSLYLVPTKPDIYEFVQIENQQELS